MNNRYTKSKQSSHPNEYVVILVLNFALVLGYLQFSYDALLYSLLALSFLGVASFHFRRWLTMGFTWLTGLIGKIVTALILALVFYGVLTPIALVKKISGKKPVSYSKKISGDSFFVTPTKEYGREDFEKMW